MVAELVPSPPPLVGCLDALDAILDDMPVEAYASLAPAMQRHAVERLRRLKARIAGQQLAAVRALDAGLGDRARTGEVLARGFGRDKWEADRSVRTAKALSAAPRTEGALAAGELAETQAAVIAGTMSGLPDDVTPQQRAVCEKTLIADAKRFPIKDLRQRALRISDAFRQPAEAAADEDEALRLRERRAWARTEAWLVDDHDGTWRFGGRLPALHGEVLKSALDAIAAPRRRHLTPEQERDQDELTYPQRMGRAFAHLIERLPTDKLPTTGGTPAVIPPTRRARGGTPTVNIDLKDLKDKIGAATLTTGTRISSRELRRLACNHGILPMVFDGHIEIRKPHGPWQRNHRWRP